MTATEILNSLVESEKDNDRLNQLFQLQTLVIGLESDLAHYQTVVAELQNATEIAQARIGELTEQLADQG